MTRNNVLTIFTSNFLPVKGPRVIWEDEASKDISSAEFCKKASRRNFKRGTANVGHTWLWHALKLLVMVQEEQVSWSGFVTPWKAVLRLFWENHGFDPFPPNKDAQVLYIVEKLWVSINNTILIITQVFHNPTNRQNFANAWAVTSSRYLTVCPNNTIISWTK